MSTAVEDAAGAPAAKGRRKSFFETLQKVDSKAKARATDFKKKKRQEKADALLAVEDSRKVPIDMLASDWLGKSGMMADTRSYFVENLLPTLIMGLEQLLKRVDDLDMADAEELDERLNPVNLLGMYLMRNNPKYSNFAEASPYMKSLKAIQDQLKGKVMEASKSRSTKLWDEVKRRMEDTLVKEEEERVAARNAKILKIPLLWAAAQAWLVGDEQRINTRSIVNGFLNFHEYLIDHGKSEYAVVVNDLFKDVPKDGVFAEDLMWTSDQLLDSLTFWTEHVREHINSEELMKMLREHLVEWFDTDPSLQGQERKRYRELFQEIDYYSEGNLNLDLVMKLVGSFSDSAALPEEAKERYVHALPSWLPATFTGGTDDDTESTVAEESVSVMKLGQPSAAADDAADGDGASAAAAAAEGDGASVPAAAEDAPAAAEGGADDAAAPPAAAAADEQAEGAAEGGAAAPAAGTEGGAAPDAAAAASDVPAAEEGEGADAGDEASAEAVAEAEAIETEQRKSIQAEFPADLPVRISSGRRRQSFYVAKNDPTEAGHMDAGRFQYLCSDLLGASPEEGVWMSFRLYVTDGFQAEREALEDTYRKKVRLEGRVHELNLIMERIDVDCSGFIEDDELGPMLAHWKDISEEEAAQQASDIMEEAGPEDSTGLLRLGQARFTMMMLDLFFKDVTDPHFEREIAKINRILDKILPDHQRFMTRKKWLEELDVVTNSAFCDAAAVYAKAFEILQADAVEFSALTSISCNVSLAKGHKGRVSSLKYVASTDSDITAVVGKTLKRSEKLTISFEAIASGLPVHIKDIAANESVYMFKEKACTAESNGDVVVFPLTDARNQKVPHGAIGTLTVDNISPDRSVTQEHFQPHQLRFFQGVSQHMSDAIRAIQVRTAAKRIAMQSVPWIKSISSSISDCVWHLVLAGNKDDPMGTVVRKFPNASMAATGAIAKPPSLGVEVLRGVRQNQFLFRSTDLRDVTSSKTDGVTYTCFPVVDKGKVIFLAVTASTDKLGSHVERDVRKLINEMEDVYKVLVQGDVPPPIDALAPPTCIWHKAKLDIDKVSTSPLYWLRFRMLSMRREAMRTFKMLFYNLNATSKPGVHTLKVISLMIRAFVGENQLPDISSWNALRKYISTDLKRAISEYDPTRIAYKKTLEQVGKELDATAREAVASESQPLITMIYDWLAISTSMAQRAVVQRKNVAGRSVGSASTGIRAASPDSEDDADEIVEPAENPAEAIASSDAAAPPAVDEDDAAAEEGAAEEGAAEEGAAEEGAAEEGAAASGSNESGTSAAAAATEGDADADADADATPATDKPAENPAEAIASVDEGDAAAAAAAAPEDAPAPSDEKAAAPTEPVAETEVAAPAAEEAVAE